MAISTTALLSHRKSPGPDILHARRSWPYLLALCSRSQIVKVERDLEAWRNHINQGFRISVKMTLFKFSIDFHKDSIESQKWPFSTLRLEPRIWVLRFFEYRIRLQEQNSAQKQPSKSNSRNFDFLQFLKFSKGMTLLWGEKFWLS